MRKGLILAGVFTAFLIGAWATEKPGANDIAQDSPAPPQIPGVPRVEVVNFPDLTRVRGTVGIDNLPAVQPVSGTVVVGNLPAVQPVSGSVAVSNLAELELSGAVEVTNLLPVSELVDLIDGPVMLLPGPAWHSEPLDVSQWASVTLGVQRVSVHHEPSLRCSLEWQFTANDADPSWRKVTGIPSR